MDIFPAIRIFQENPQKRIHRFAQMDTDFEKKPQITQMSQISTNGVRIHRFSQMSTDFRR